MSQQTKSLVVFALLLVLALATLESTIVATAMPSIVARLGGITLYSWVFSAYLLTSTITVPLYGKLADLYGRRIILFIGTGIFLLGSIACGSAQSMEQLIISRAVQGWGAGAIPALVLTIIADISRSPEELAGKQGLIGALWGFSSIGGPLLGGVIVESVSWQWIFYMNVPLGILALGLLLISYKEKAVSQKRHMDYLGTALLTGAVLALLLALIQGGNSWAWNSPPSMGLFVVSLVCLIAFWYVEKKAAEPMIPLNLLKDRTIAIATMGTLLLGAMLFGITTYVPLFVQGVLGKNATEGGLPLLVNSLSWSLISICTAVILRYLGFRLMVLIGTLCVVSGGAVIVFLPGQDGFVFLFTAMVLIGVGFGLVNIVYTMAVQQAAPAHLLGVVTASNQFARLLGGTVGIAIMGSILNGQITQRFAALAAQHPPLAAQMRHGESLATLLLTDKAHLTFLPALLTQLREAFAQSLFWVFVFLLLLALVSLVLVLFFPSVPIAQQQLPADEPQG